jgi:hypothetical protein
MVLWFDCWIVLAGADLLLNRPMAGSSPIINPTIKHQTIKQSVGSN